MQYGLYKTFQAVLQLDNVWLCVWRTCCSAVWAVQDLPGCITIRQCLAVNGGLAVVQYGLYKTFQAVLQLDNVWLCVWRTCCSAVWAVQDLPGCATIRQCKVSTYVLV